MTWFREGFEHIVPLHTFQMLSWHELEERVIGYREISSELLQRITDADFDHPMISMFFDMFETFTQL